MRKRARHQVEVVRLDGEPLPGLRANEPFPIDPGVHALEARLTCQPPQALRVSVAERQIYTWALSGLPNPKANEEPKSGPEALVAPAPALGSPPSKPSPPWTIQRKAAVVFAGSSLAAFGVATGLAVNAWSIYRSSEAYCTPAGTCQTEGIRRRDRARAQGAAATVGFTIGIASAVAGGTLWLTGGRDAPERSDAIRIGVSGLGLGEASDFRVVLEGRY